MKYDVIIVGAGASGMMAAITAASHHKKVLLLERMDKLGKKILATGNGRCNLSNAYMDENCYRGQRPSFAYPMIEEFGLEDLIQFFESLGMLVTEQNGYYYPASLQAATVVDTLTQKLKHLHVDILTEFEVTKAEKRKSTFYVYGNDKCFQSSNLILATGGCAQPNLGSNGSGYKLAKDFHHKITDTFPSLVGLEAEKEKQHYELITPRGGEFKITLPDGTFVHLNSNSKLRFPKNFAPDKREIFLSGEAYFEVSKDTNKPFLVIAEDVQVKVYGTTFNINTLLGNQIQTTLVKGSVGIRVQDSSQEYILKPSQQAIVEKTDGNITIREVDTTPYTAWTEGIFLFDNERLETILDKLALWYDVELFYQNESVKDVRFTGYLKRYDNIDVILNAIESTVSATFHIKERTIIINKNEYTNR